MRTWGWNVDVDSDGVLMLVQKAVQASLGVRNFGICRVTRTLHVHLSVAQEKMLLLNGVCHVTRICNVHLSSAQEKRL